MSNHRDLNQQCSRGDGSNGNLPNSLWMSDARETYYPTVDRLAGFQQGRQQHVQQNSMPSFQTSFNQGGYNGAFLSPAAAAGVSGRTGAPCYPNSQGQYTPRDALSHALPAEPDMTDRSLIRWARKTLETAEDDSLDCLGLQPTEKCKAQEASRRESLTFLASPGEGTFGSKKAKTQLPPDFNPGSYSVILGRGRCTESAGNKRFKMIVNNHLQEYVEAPGKLEKTFIVSKVINIVKDMCPVGAFVKYENGNWFSVGERAAREKVGACFRDALHTMYKSSSKSKVARRKSKEAESLRGS